MVDGQVTGKVKRNKDNAGAFDAYYYLAVNMGLQGPNSIYGGNQTYDYTNLPATAEVDWVKVWQRPGQSDIKTDYAASHPVTQFSGGNFLLRGEHTPAIYRYAYTEGQQLAFWTPNINLANPVAEYDANYPLLPNKGALQEGAYEGGSYMDMSINNWGVGWHGGGWYSEFPLDLSAYENGNLVFHLKSNDEIDFFNLGMIDAVGGQTEVSLADAGGFVADGEWHRVSIPLAKFAAGVDLSQLHYPLYLAAQEAAPNGDTFEYGLDNIYFEWPVNDTLIYPSPVDNTLVFNFQFEQAYSQFKLNLKVNGKKQAAIILKDVAYAEGENGQASYLWHSCLSYPEGSVIEANVEVIGKYNKVTFPANGQLSAPYTVPTGNLAQHKSKQCK